MIITYRSERDSDNIHFIRPRLRSDLECTETKGVALVLGAGIQHIFFGIKYSKKGIQLGRNSTIPKCMICFLIPLSFIFGCSIDVIRLILFLACIMP